jgi:hypothetical protein
MDGPNCLTCDLNDQMILEDSGPTFTTWHCRRCNVKRTKKTILGKVLPIVPLLLLGWLGLGGDGGAGGSPDAS